MSVLIKGMEMPKEGYVDVRIKCNGTASFAIADNPYFKAVEAVPVPPHGRLIDADALIKLLDNCMFPSDMATTRAVSMARNWLIDAPTIIPAEEKKNG